MAQLELSWRNEDTLRHELESHTGMALSLTLTDNTSTMLSMRRDSKRNRMQLRIHRMFLAADPHVVRALADWLVRPRAPKSGALIDHFIEANRHHIKPARQRSNGLRTKGQVYDLDELFREVNASHFEDTVSAAITWGRMPVASRRRRRSIRFGSYTQEDHLVRIHPLLDQGFVPRYAVRYIVFHEMLHAFLGVGMSPTGRRQVHTPEFRRLELAYPDYGRSVSWLEAPRNLNRFLAQMRG